MKSNPVRFTIALIATMMLSLPAWATEWELYEPEGWGVDRINQDGPVISADEPTPFASNRGVNVTVYIVSTGINPWDAECGNRCYTGYSAFEDGRDDHGMGMDIMKIIAGNSYGIASSANVVGVKVLNQYGWGLESDIIDGIDWIADNHDGGANVAIIGLGAGDIYPSLDNAVERLVASGVTTIVPTGSSFQNTCTYSPARASSTITVGNVWGSDQMNPFADFGPCIDLLAPLETRDGVRSSQFPGALAAGVATVLLDLQPQMSPSQIKTLMINTALKDRISGLRPGTPNLLLHIDPALGF